MDCTTKYLCVCLHLQSQNVGVGILLLVQKSEGRKLKELCCYTINNFCQSVTIGLVDLRSELRLVLIFLERVSAAGHVLASFP